MAQSISHRLSLSRCHEALALAGDLEQAAKVLVVPN